MHPMPSFSREMAAGPALARSSAEASQTAGFGMGGGLGAFVLPSLAVSAPMSLRQSAGPHLAPLRQLGSPKACRFMACPNVAASLHGYCAAHAHNELDAYKPQESTPMILPPLRRASSVSSTTTTSPMRDVSASDYYPRLAPPPALQPSVSLPSLPSIHMSVLTPPVATMNGERVPVIPSQLPRSPMHLTALSARHLLPPTSQVVESNALLELAQGSAMQQQMQMQMQQPQGLPPTGMNMNMTTFGTQAAPLAKPILKCRRDNCPNTARRKGLCMEHGGRHFCKMEGCSKCAHRGGYCIAHGGGRRCAVHNCTKSAQSGGVCYSHGGGKRCATDGCTHAARSGGFCIKHGKQLKHRGLGAGFAMATAASP